MMRLCVACGLTEGLSHDAISADDVTECGKYVIDVQRMPNGKQSTIGSLFRKHANAGHLVWYGNVVKSKTPSRNGGIIRVWAVTSAGRMWAEQMLDE
jgi:hypothetical protein